MQGLGFRANRLPPITRVQKRDLNSSMGAQLQVPRLTSSELGRSTINDATQTADLHPEANILDSQTNRRPKPHSCGLGFSVYEPAQGATSLNPTCLASVFGFRIAWEPDSETLGLY